MPKNTRPWAISMIVLVLAFDLAFAWQWSLGAYRSEFGGHPDEPAHVVTGLFVRDALIETWHYAAGGFHGSPLRLGKEFADRYYTHYPKIGLGVWPPFFYLVQSAWTLTFGASRTALFFLLCTLAAMLAWQLFGVLRKEFGLGLAAFGAAVLLSLPLVRSYYGMIMAETLSALLMFGAIVFFGRFLDQGKRADAIWFGVFAALAILTKGTGLALALAAPLAVLFTRRWSVLKRPVLWLATLIVLVVAGPWTWATRNLGKGGWLQPNPRGVSRASVALLCGKIWPLARGGAGAALCRRRRGQDSPLFSKSGFLGGGGSVDRGGSGLPIDCPGGIGSAAPHSDSTGGLDVCRGGGLNSLPGIWPTGGGWPSRRSFWREWLRLSCR